MRRFGMDHRGGDARGFTLPEVVLSMAVCSVLLGAMTSLVVVASRSIPARGTDSTLSTAAAGALEQLASDLAVATSIVSATASEIEFKVPDRNRDGQEETIVYRWQGVVGGPLVRSVNADAKGELVRPVSAFELSYTTTESKTNLASTIVAGGEQVVSTWSAGALGGLLYLGHTLASGKPLGQNFRPNLPTSTKSWKVTRIQFYGASDVARTGTTQVELRTTNAVGLPTETVLAKGTILESALPLLTYGMNEVTFTNAPELAPDQEIAIVFVCVQGCPSATLGYTTLAIARTTPMETQLAGVWTASTLNVMPYIAYGTTTTTVAHSTTSRQLMHVGARLQLGSATTPILGTTVNLLNTPEVQ